LVGRLANATEKPQASSSGRFRAINLRSRRLALWLWCMLQWPLAKLATRC